MFSPPGMDETDEIYHAVILILQCAYFGLFPDKYVELAENITVDDLNGIEGLVNRKGGRRRYRNTLTTYLSEETVDFLDKVMDLDTRDRPSPQELLQEQQLSGVVD